MTRLVILRHGPTDWNAEGRLQGRTDIPLSEQGRVRLAMCNLPERFRQRQWYTSPLLRARETAALLGIAPVIEPALIEMDWGQYEGRTLAELRETHGAAFAANEERGLDLQPPGGESPRQVQNRLRSWLRQIAASGKDAGAVTHKGVIRSVIAMAFDWPMIGKQPAKLDWACLHEFRINPQGHPEVLTLNIPWD